MTFEEMQNIIQSMLAVQRELQESQVELKEGQQEVRASLETMRASLEAMRASLETMRATQQEFRGSLEVFRATQQEFRMSLEALKGSQEAQSDVLRELIGKYGDLASSSVRQNQILDRLIGYSLNNESDHLNLEEKLQALEARVKRIESSD
ncbi:hypothetical protein [Roseofilum capinflatum]|uniref:Uncharacterized protein n=1 Tax=Roseofilum capinflatum BLCC-M114 TaxID=3022440 RepID=A0ABT7B7X4_9CYAN|nr:hypothetical protein [Roseofilum capinflatum]MDJ1175255.1 hypothetical protein [Roseofilum capinflatum BLCC-M114]